MRGALYRLLRLTPGVAIAVTLIFPVTASAAVTSIQVVSGELVAKGAEVDLTISFTCTAGDTIAAPMPPMGGGLSAELQQAISKTEQASGFGFGLGGQTCTGSPQTAVVQVLATAPGPPFRVGPAVATVFISECGPTGCSFVGSAPNAIRISN
jgi:hypothetical protein